MEIIFNKQAYGAVKENLDKKRFFDEGPKEKLPKGQKAEVKISQPVDKKNQGKFRADYEVENLKYSNKENEKPAEEYSSEKVESLSKGAKQELPSKENIKGGENITSGPKGDAKTTTQKAEDPKIKMQGLSTEEGKKSIDGGPKEKLQYPAGNPVIKIDWNVNVDKAIGKSYSEKPEMGDIKKVKKPASDPNVSQQRLKDVEGVSMSDYEHTSPLQKQFSINWKAETLEEKKENLRKLFTCVKTDFEMLAKAANVSLWDSPLKNSYAEIVLLEQNLDALLNKEISKKAAYSEESRVALKEKYGGESFDMSKCIKDQEGNVDNPGAFCKWISEATSKSASITKKAAKAENPDTSKEDEKTGKILFS